MQLLIIIEGKNHEARVAIDKLLSPDGEKLAVINCEKRSDIPRTLTDQADEILCLQTKWFKRRHAAEVPA